MVTPNAGLSTYREDGTGDLIVYNVPQMNTFMVPVVAHNDNLALYIEDTELQQIGTWVGERVQEDLDSRQEWEKQVVRALELLGIGPESEPDDSEYENSDTSNSTLLIKAIVRFLSTSQAEMLPADRICKADPAVDTTQLPPDKRKQVDLELEASCNRSVDFFTHYLTRRLPTYVEDNDRALFDTGVSGVGFKKIYVDRSHPDPVRVDMVRSENLIIAYDAASMRSGAITHRLDMKASELIRRMTAGVYMSVDLTPTADLQQDKITKARDKIQGITSNTTAPKDTYRLYERHCEMHLASDPHPQGLMRPYVVTIDAENNKVLSIRRNWVEGDAAERRQEAFVAYQIHPGNSAIYGWGLGHILANITGALRSGQRRALEAAYLQNHPAGYKSSTLSIRDDNKRIVPGEFVDVDTPAQRISDALYLFEFKGPSPGLISLMQMLSDEGKELAGLTAQDLGELLSKDTPVGSMLAVLEEATKFEGAIHSRVYRAQSTEYEIIQARMIQAFNGNTQIYDAGKVLKQGDLAQVRIVPAMQPGQANRQRRILEAQALREVSISDPDVIDKREATINYVQALGVDNLEKYLVPPPEETKPADAVTEHNAALQGKPLKAGPAQNHQAHIAAHETSMRNYMDSDLPVDVGQRAVTSMAAHIAEHMALEMAALVSAELGIPMEALQEGIPPEVEYQISPAIAVAMQRLEERRKATEPPSPEDVRLLVEQMRGENRLLEIDRRGAWDMQRQTQSDRSDEKQNTDDNVTAIELQSMKMADNRAKEQNSPNVGVSTGAPSQNRNPNPGR